MLAWPAMSAASNPTDPAPSVLALAEACVRCGLCLPHCPTYALDGRETESPRGRIALAQALAGGKDTPNASLDEHLDHCLGCGRCETVCPARVRYGELLSATRALQRRRRSPGLRQRWIETLAARPRWLDRALGLYRVLHPLLPGRLRPVPKPPAATATRAGGNAASPALFLGCVARRYEGPARAALLRLLAAAGQDAAIPDGQTCCGALHAHAGDAGTADALAVRNRSVFAGRATVLCPASGCLGSLSRALPDSAVLDPLQWLERQGDRLRFSPTPMRIALHWPCTQAPAARAALRTLLAAIPQLDVIEVDAGHGCCGAAGMHMIAFPERAARLRQPLLDQLGASGASLLLSANIGCRLHLATARVPVRHPLEFLAERLDMDGGGTTAALS